MLSQGSKLCTENNLSLNNLDETAKKSFWPWTFLTRASTAQNSRDVSQTLKLDAWQQKSQ